LGDIDEVREEMIECRLKLGVIDDATVDQIVEYSEKTWINDTCQFQSLTLNLFSEYSSCTNNICESYNHQINGQVHSSKANIYKIVTLTQKQESLASTTHGECILEKKKRKKLLRK
jgi:hypothetical protein